VGEKYNVDLSDLKIVASNEINELTLRSLEQQEHEIDIFGVGTHLVTCQSEPSLGCVYKLVQVNGQPKIKLSQEAAKVTIPGRKTAYRLIGEQGWPLADLLMLTDEEPPQVGKKILCCHPYEEKKRTYVIPSEVAPLHLCVWDGRAVGAAPPLAEIRRHAHRQVASLRSDHLRPLNPTPYKVSLSSELYNFMHRLWLEEAPITEMR
jgi:nicotinate phosphoribosyltransferase